jgi:carbonic anhydrase
MDTLPNLFEQNRKWAAAMEAEDPGFFASLAKQQHPEYLWIGCSDSRVPANEIVGLRPGELFVHRNVANLVVHTDLNCLSVMQYAVDVLRVKHIIVCGHQNCGGVIAALRGSPVGLVDNWLRHIQDIYRANRDEIESLETESRKVRKLIELNIREQVNNVARTTVVQNAWSAGNNVAIHGWVYDVADGLLQAVQNSVRSENFIA